jgi:hypothetical protein
MSAWISLRITLLAELLEAVVWSSIGHNGASGSFSECDITVPLASWIRVADVEVKVIVQPLLQYSARPTRERLRALSSKM